MEDRINEVLTLVGMENKGYRMPNTLSGGEQQRVVIARALLNNPSVILADEPTGNLDPETGSNIVQLLYDICHQRNTAVLMSTHNLQLLEQFPGRVLRVEDGKINSDSATESDQVFEAPVVAEMSEEQEDLNPQEEPSDLVSEEVVQPVSAIIEEEMEAEPVEVQITPQIQFETNEEAPAEIQNDSAPDSDAENSVEGHCLQSENQPEEQNRSEQSDQIPSVSAGL